LKLSEKGLFTFSDLKFTLLNYGTALNPLCPNSGLMHFLKLDKNGYYLILMPFKGLFRSFMLLP